MEALREQGIRVLVEMDEPPWMPFVVWAAAGNLEGAPRNPKVLVQHAASCRDDHLRLVEMSDGVICSTDAVAREHSAKPTWVCPSSVEPDDWPEPAKPRDGILRIGLAGSAVYRVGDFEVARDALCWASGQPDVEVVLMGADPRWQMTPAEIRERHALYFVSGRWRETAKTPEEHEARVRHVERENEMRRAHAARQAAWRFAYRHIPEAPLTEYRQNLAQLDIGICPQLDDETSINRCGSDLKPLDYTMAGAVPICSDVEAYQWWRDKPLPLATGSAGLLELVQHLAANRGEVARLARLAREHVLAERTIEQSIHLWREACAA